MSDLYTLVEDSRGNSYMLNGRRTRDDVIQEGRAHYQYALNRATEFLAEQCDDLKVRVVRGSYVQHFVEELKP